jgi:tetratricopeptide (TPR) repeat protein
MTHSGSETASLDVPQPARVDRWLNIAVAVLVVLVLGVAMVFAYSVYRDRQAQEASSASGRIAAALESQVRKSPNDVVLRVRLGEAYGALGKYQQAIEQFNAALKINPNHSGAYLDLGMVAMLTKNNSSAKTYFQKVISVTDGSEYAGLSSVREQAFYNLGVLALGDKNYSEAAANFKAALQLRRDSSDSYYQLAKALQGLGATDDAIHQLEIGLQFDPGFAEARYFLGQLYQQKKDDVNASYQFAQAVKLAPGSDPPRQALDAYGSASEWIDKAKKALASGEIEGALTDVLVARNLDDKSFEAAKLHGQILVKRGNPKDALDVFQQAAKLNPKDAEVQAQISALTKQVAALTKAKNDAARRAAKKAKAK